MTNGEARYNLDRVVRMVLSAITLVAVLALLRYLSDVLVPFAAAVILAYLLNPLVTAFEQKTKRRGPAVALTIGGLGLVGLTVVILLVPLVAGQIGRFRDSVGRLREDLASSVESRAEPAGLSSSVPGEAHETPPTPPVKSELGWRELKDAWAQFRQDAKQKPRSERLRRLRDAIDGTYVGDLLEKLVAYTDSAEFNQLLIDTAKKLAIGGWTVLSFAVNLVLGLTGLIIVLLYLVFLLMDYPQYARTWKSFLPPQYREPIVEFLDQFNAALRRYFRGQAVVALLMGILFAAGFSIIGLPMAVPCGLFIGLLNMVPYLQAVGLVPAMLLAGLRAVEQESSFLVSVLLTLLVFVAAQVIQDALITPRVMGKATGLRPVAILLGVFIWGKLLGFLGLLLAIPLTCLGIAYYRRYVLLPTPEKTKLTAE